VQIAFPVCVFMMDERSRLALRRFTGSWIMQRHDAALIPEEPGCETLLQTAIEGVLSQQRFCLQIFARHAVAGEHEFRRDCKSRDVDCSRRWPQLCENFSR